MNKRVLAIGNILLTDDGVAIYLCDHIKNKLESMGYELYKCETDVSYAVSLLNEKDIYIILDAAFTGGNAGEVRCLSFKDYEKEFYKNEMFSHNISIYDYIFKSGKDIKGWTVLVEVCSLELNKGLSEIIGDRLEEIGEKVIECIEKEVIL